MFEDLLGDAFWPGDAEWPGLVDKLDLLCYSKAVPVARDVAPKIADYLRQRNNENDVLIVHFLAHSLGCRVTLEVIDSLARNGGPKVGKVCLMAAAVPTFKVCPGGSLYNAVTQASQLRVLFSPADPVLGGAFPPGQTIARGDEGFFPQALGLNGDIPSMSGKIDRDHIDGARHSDYWGYTTGFSTDLSAKSIFEFFRFDGVAQRTLGERPLPASRCDVPKRQVATPDLM
jgi:hypothetical protein